MAVIPDDYLVRWGSLRFVAIRTRCWRHLSGVGGRLAHPERTTGRYRVRSRLEAFIAADTDLMLINGVPCSAPA
jgi:hypothetical protein